MSIMEFSNTLTAYRKEKYAKREVGLTDAEFRAFIIDYLLGEDWYVVDPVPQVEVNKIALCRILERYSKRYRKEKRLNEKQGRK